MKCPKCGYNSFDYLDNCKRCNTPLKPKTISRHHNYKSIEDKDKSEIDLSDYVSDLPDSYTNKTNKNISENYEVNVSKKNDYEPVAGINKDEFKEILDKLEDYKIGHEVENADTLVVRNKETVFDRVATIFQRKIVDKENKNPDDATIIIQNIATIKSRFLAFIIDLLLVVLISLGAFIFGLRQITLDYSYDIDELFFILVQIYFILVFFASTYFLFLLGYSGKTIGKMLLKIKVVKEDGSDIGYYISMKRWIGSILSAIPLFLGFLWIIFNDKKQSLHDKFAKTLVIKTLK
ncbi:MAG: RDD family protein [Thermodesulfobacteriota bacterium]